MYSILCLEVKSFPVNFCYGRTDGQTTTMNDVIGKTSSNYLYIGYIIMVFIGLF